MLFFSFFSFFLRLQRIHLAKKLMPCSSTLRTFWHHQPHFSSTPSMTHTEKVRILFVGIHSVFVRVSQQLFLMASGSTFLIMMPQLSLSSLWKETLGIWCWYNKLISCLLRWLFLIALLYGPDPYKIRVFP